MRKMSNLVAHTYKAGMKLVDFHHHTTHDAYVGKVVMKWFHYY